jgi:ammonia channel protein AmtB
MQFLNTQDPFWLALVAGAIGGLVRAVVKSELVAENTPNRFFRIIWQVIKHLFFGIVTGGVIWTLSESTDDNLGVFAIGVISGFAGIYLLDLFAENRETHERIAGITKQLALQNDMLEAMVKRLETEKEPSTSDEPSAG